MSLPFGFLIFNAFSGKGDKPSSADILAELPAGTRLHEFTDGDDPVALSKQALAEGAAWIAVAGGDGTIEAVAGMLAGTEVPLGIITSGTYNNFSRSAGLPEDPLEAARLIRSGSIRRVDVGYVNGHPFFECIGAGLDAAIFPEAEQIKSGGMRGWFGLFKKAFHYQRQIFEIELDRPLNEAVMQDASTHRGRKWLKSTSKHLRISALQIAVSNGPFYGMNFAVAPDARIDDGELTVSIFRKYSKAELWWHFFSISFGRRAYAPKVVTLVASKLKISGPRQTEVHLDGTPLEEWPLEISLQSKQLRIFGTPGG